LHLLRRHEAELCARGGEALTVFGSRPRGDASEGSDVDLAVLPGPTFSSGGFDHFGKLDALRDHLATVLVARSTSSKKRRCDHGYGK